MAIFKKSMIQFIKNSTTPEPNDRFQSHQKHFKAQNVENLIIKKFKKLFLIILIVGYHLQTQSQRETCQKRYLKEETVSIQLHVHVLILCYWMCAFSPEHTVEIICQK